MELMWPSKGRQAKSLQATSHFNGHFNGYDNVLGSILLARKLKAGKERKLSQATKVSNLPTFPITSWFWEAHYLMMLLGGA